MSSGHFDSSPSPQCSHYNQPGIIVPPPSTANLTVTSSNPVLSNSPCPECALHSTILHSMAFNMSSMDAACHHLHASASCSSCYSNFQLQQQRLGFDNDQHSHYQPMHPGTRQYQCGHVQQPYPTDPYYPQNDNIQPQASSSYPNYPYQDWGQASSRNGYSSHSPNSLQTCYDISSSGPIIPLPSPTISIPSINPYLSSLENPAKTFELPPVSEITGSAMTSQNAFTTDNLQCPYQNTTGQVDSISSNGSYTKFNDNPANPLSAISSMKISDDVQELKSETRNGKIEFQRRKPKQNTEKRKSKPEKTISSEVRKRQPEDVCQVCGDRASGYHYNALTCEGCKGFFRRSITNKSTYKQGCKQGGNCEMDTYTRRKCPFCRLKKCREVGMLEECLLTEIQCQSKRRRRKAKQEQQEEATHEETPQSENQVSPDVSSIASSPCNSDSSRNDDGNSISLTLTEDERSIVDTVSEAFKHYKINPEIVRRWEKYINKESNKTCRLSDITTVHVQVLVEYTKSLPGFITLDPEDQIALLKGSVMEAILLRNSCGYNHLTREINIPAILEETGAEVSQIKALTDFFAVVGRLNMNEIEYALLIAIVIFNSDYPYVKNKATVEEYQDQYLSTLAKYSISREPHRPFVFARILAILTEIRTLSHYNAELVTSWKKRDTLTPLLCEIWDLD